jgi:hypothetical protein
MGHIMLKLTVVRAEPVELERELLDLEQLRWRVVERFPLGCKDPVNVIYFASNSLS